MMRPDDLDLLRQTGRNLRRDADIPVVFGGLRSEGHIRVSMTAGDETGRLSSITLEPARGLGGRSWLTRRPLLVEDYAKAEEITHDFDRQILGEGITFLAVAPIVVRKHVRGLIYAGSRDGARWHPDRLDALRRAARAVAGELDVRDQVDARVRMLDSAVVPPAGPTGEAIRELHAQLRVLADGTSDPVTAAHLRALLDDSSASDDGTVVTSRQLDVLTHVALGLRNSEIADRLGLSVTTVKSYLRAAMTRLDAGSRHEAVVHARRRGILP